MDKDGAIKDFKKKFRDKTKNNWDERGQFPTSTRKIHHDRDGWRWRWRRWTGNGKGCKLQILITRIVQIEFPFPQPCLRNISFNKTARQSSNLKIIFQTAKLDKLDGVKRKVAACTLDKPTQDLVKLIFDNDMFKEAMQTFHIGNILMFFGAEVRFINRLLFILFKQNLIYLLTVPLQMWRKCHLESYPRLKLPKALKPLRKYKQLLKVCTEMAFLRGLYVVLRNNDICMPYQCHSTKVSFGF